MNKSEQNSFCLNDILKNNVHLAKENIQVQLKENIHRRKKNEKKLLFTDVFKENTSIK